MSGRFTDGGCVVDASLAMRTSVSTAARMMRQRCEENRKEEEKVKCNAEEDQVQKSGQMSGRPKPATTSKSVAGIAPNG